jgi:hypothetical protein
MTPERKAYNDYIYGVNEAQLDIHSTLHEVVDAAAAAGIVATITVVSLQPLAMGHIELDVDTRPSLATWRKSEELRRAAEESEKELP